VIAELVQAKIWIDEGPACEFFYLHDFLDWNMSKAQWEAKKAAAKLGGKAKAAKVSPKKSQPNPAKTPANSLPHGIAHGTPDGVPKRCQSSAKVPADPLPDSDSEIDLPDQNNPPNPPAMKPKPTLPHGTHELKLHFVAEFLRLRNAKFDLPPKIWGRAQTAFGGLVETYTLDGAKGILTKALGSPWCNRVNPWEILADAAHYLGEKPSTQLGLLNGSKPEKWGPGGGNGPQPNASDPRDRYVARRFGETDDEFEQRKADVKAGKRGPND
jgi:hypothetical protein